MYNPKVSMPFLSNNIPQMRSEAFQPRFYFGGAQSPNDLHLRKGTFSGSGAMVQRCSCEGPPITLTKSSPVIKMKGHNNRKVFVPRK